MLHSQPRISKGPPAVHHQMQGWGTFLCFLARLLIFVRTFVAFRGNMTMNDMGPARKAISGCEKGEWLTLEHTHLLQIPSKPNVGPLAFSPSNSHVIKLHSSLFTSLSCNAFRSAIFFNRVKRAGH